MSRTLNLTTSNMILTIGGQFILLFITGLALYFGIDELVPNDAIRDAISSIKQEATTKNASTSTNASTSNPVPTIASMPSITPTNMTRPVAAAVAKVIANKK